MSYFILGTLHQISIKLLNENTLFYCAIKLESKLRRRNTTKINYYHFKYPYIDVKCKLDVKFVNVPTFYVDLYRCLY